MFCNIIRCEIEIIRSEFYSSCPYVVRMLIYNLNKPLINDLDHVLLNRAVIIFVSTMVKKIDIKISKHTC